MIFPISSIVSSKIRSPIFWLNKLPQLVREADPIVFPRPASFTKPGCRLEVPVLRVGSRLTRSISQVSSFSRPNGAHLKRSLSIVSRHSRNSSHCSRSQTPRNTLVPVRESRRSDIVITGCGWVASYNIRDKSNLWFVCVMFVNHTKILSQVFYMSSFLRNEPFTKII